MDRIDELTSFMKDCIESREKELGLMTELLAKSEQRIDVTNKMVNKLAFVVTKLTETYETHLSTLAGCRDELAHTNSILVKELAAEREHREDCEKRLQSVIDKILTSSKMNINVS